MCRDHPAPCMATTDVCVHRSAATAPGLALHLDRSMYRVNPATEHMRCSAACLRLPSQHASARATRNNPHAAPMPADTHSLRLLTAAAAAVAHSQVLNSCVCVCVDPPL
eukprot:GHRQ01024834.1.p2 GENE.GHRQ01024834.1~~GHRQ01024834.1.p2  ORF type:complete len:109 (+),score=8.45 GHRQ01024834.1:229-555(+)